MQGKYEGNITWVDDTRFSRSREEIERELAEIKTKAIADGTFMKAPNGKRSNLDERQWLHVRLKSFKKWFGDWENWFKKNFLLNGRPVATLTGGEFARVEGKSLTDQVEEYFNSIGNKAVSPLYGDVVLDRRGADDSLAHGMGRNKAVAYRAVKDVIENGILIDYHENHKNRGYDSAVISAPIIIGNERYICSVVITRMEDNRFYLHEVIEQKRLSDEGSNTVQGQPQRPKAFANILQNILNASDDVSKVVDENGEPMEVYHQTNSTIHRNIETGEIWDELDWRAKQEWEERDDWEEYWVEEDFYTFDNKNHARRSVEMPAFFFSPTYDEYHEYGKRTIPAFLNIRNPKINPTITDAGVTNTAGEDAMKMLIEEGYDGFIREYDGVVKEINAFFSNQIKSSTDNIGSYDGENEDIRFSRSNANQEIFISNAQRAVEGIKQDKATPEVDVTPEMKESVTQGQTIFVASAQAMREAKESRDKANTESKPKETKSQTDSNTDVKSDKEVKEEGNKENAKPKSEGDDKLTNDVKTGGGKEQIGESNERVVGEKQRRLSNNEYDEDGSPFVLSSSGTTIFGKIKEESGLTSAPIKLSLGNSKYGLVHIEKRHGKQIRNAGFKSVEEFVEYVCQNYTQIRRGENSVGEENGTYLLQIKDAHNNTLYVELSSDGNYWGVNSGGVFRKEYGNNKKEVWSASEVQNEQSATDNTLREVDKSDNPKTPNGNVSTTSSFGKDSKKSETTKQNDVNEPTESKNEKVRRKKKQPSLQSVALNKKEQKLKPVLTGINHLNGYAIATDEHIMVADKRLYDPELEGKAELPDGKVMDGYQPMLNVLSEIEKRDFHAKIDMSNLAEVLEKNELKNTSIKFKLPFQIHGRKNVYARSVDIKKFVDFANANDINEISFLKNGYMFAKNNDISIILMLSPSTVAELLDFTIQLEDNGGDVVIRSNRSRHTRFSISHTAEEFEATQRQAVEEKGIVMPGLNNAIVNVVDVPRHDFTGRGIDAIHKAEDWSNKNIVGEHIYHNGQEDEFKYTIDKEAISKFLSKSSTTESDNLGVHLAVLKKLPEVIDNSIDVEIHPDYKKVGNKRSADNGVGNEDLLVHRMYGAVSIDGRIYRAKTTIHEFKYKDNRAYDYKITEVKLIVSGSSTSNARTNSTSVSATKVLNGVEKSYDKGKKILEESKNNTRFSRKEEIEEHANDLRFCAKKDLKDFPTLYNVAEKYWSDNKHKMSKMVNDAKSVDALVDLMDALYNGLMEEYFQSEAEVNPNRVRHEIAQLKNTDPNTLLRILNAKGINYKDDVDSYTKEELIEIGSGISDVLTEKRRAVGEQWKEVLERENVPTRYLVLRSLLQYISKNKEAVPVNYLEGAFVKTMDRFNESANPTSFNFYAEYNKSIAEVLFEDTDNVIEISREEGNGISGKWGRMKKQSESADVEETKAKVSAISYNTSWCTKQANVDGTGAKKVIEEDNHDFYVFVKDGETTGTMAIVPIREEEGEDVLKSNPWYTGIFKQSNGSDNSIEPEYFDVVNALARKANDTDLVRTLDLMGYNGMTKEEMAELQRQKHAKQIEWLNSHETITEADFADINDLFGILLHKNGDDVVLHELTQGIYEQPNEEIRELFWEKVGGIINVIEGDVITHNNSQLTLPNLTSVGGDVRTYDNSQLTLPNVTSVGGSVVTNGGSQLTLPNVTSIGGSVATFSYQQLTLPNVTSIGGSVATFSYQQLTLPNVTNIGGDVTTSEDSQLTLPNVTRIDGDVRTYDNSQLTLPNLTSVGGFVETYDKTQLTLPNLTSVDGDVKTHGNSQLTLPNLMNIGGFVEAWKFSNLNLPNVTSVGGRVVTRNYSQLTLPNLTSVGGFVETYDDTQLTLPNVTNIGDSVVTNDNSQLTLPNVANIGGFVETNDNSHLTLPSSMRGEYEGNITWADNTRFSRSREEIERELAEIKTKAIADSTFMKAPNGKRSYLGERQWLHVRLKSFKKWFGDWENWFKKNFLLNGRPVATLTGGEFARVEGKSLTDQVEEYFNSIGNKAVSPLYGDVVLDRRGADDSLAHGMGRNKAVAYRAVKDVIENGILIDYHENHKNRGYDSAVVVAPIEIKGERYFCYVTITRMNGTNRYYLHEVWTQKNLTNVGSNAVQGQPSHLQGTANILQNILNASDDVSKVVDENGEPMEVYHGTRRGVFTIFDTDGEGKTVDTGAFFTEDINNAMSYSKDGYFFGNEDFEEYDEFGSEYGTSGNYAVFLNVRNPDVRDFDGNDWDDIWGEKWKVNNEDGYVAGFKTYSEAREYVDSAEDREELRIEEDDYTETLDEYIRGVRKYSTERDGVYAKNIYDGGSSLSINNEWIVFSPNQIKSSTDNVGTYDGENEDIRFSVSRDKNLIAVHNLTEDKLRRVIDMGALVMPSIAITNTKIGHDTFGDISLLFDKDTIDPSDRRNKVYGGDAWTPRFPHIEPKINESVAKDFRKKIEELFSDNRLRELYHISSEVAENNISDNLRNGGIERYYNKEFMKHAYLLDKGKKVEIPMKHKDYGEYSDVVIDLAKARGVNLSDIYSDASGVYRDNKDFVNELHERIIDNKVSSLSISEVEKEKVRGLLRGKGMAFGEFDRLVRQAFVKERDLNNGGLKDIVDSKALLDDINSRVNSNNANYRKWVNDLFDGIIEKYGIRNNKDWYTPSGMQRDWNELYDNVTPSNILKHMLSESQQGGQGFFNSSIFGASAEEYGSIEEIRERGKERLREEDKKSYEDWTESVYNRLSEMGRDVLGDDSSFGDRMDFNQRVIDAVSNKKIASGIYREVKRFYPKFTMSHAKQVEDIVKEIQAHAIGYFEAKPQRIISLDEVKTAVVPTGTSADVIDGLKGYGVEVVTYRRGNDNGHKRAVERASKDIRFSVGIDNSKARDLFKDPETNQFFVYKNIDGFNRWLKEHAEDVVRLYHGTGESVDVANQGLLRTTNKRRRTYQSTPGYVYLSLYPSTAQLFGELAYPYESTKVYAVDVKIKELKPDLDQIANKRLYDEDLSQLGNSLAESLIYGGGARVKRNIFPYELSEIRFRISNENQRIFVSNAERAVEGIKQDKATPEQWLKMIEKQGGLKAGEDKWLGLSDWLKANDKKSITKQEILDFIGENKIEIEEVKYGSQQYPQLEEMANTLNEEYNTLIADGMTPDEAWYSMEEKYDLINDAFYMHNFNSIVDVDAALDMYYDRYGVNLEEEGRAINSTRLDYTTEGLENKREIALTVPTIESWNEDDDAHFGDAGGGRAVAWVRFGDTTDTNGKRVLIIDEIQSKRHQEGRERGYQSKEIADLWKEKERLNDKKRHSVITEEESKRDQEISQRLLELDPEGKQTYGVPSAPFEKNWHELAMKRMLRLAAEEGYDKVAWTKGEQQAERYNLSEKVDEIIYKANNNGTYRVSAMVAGRGHKLGDEIPQQELSNYVGKELADRIINSEGYKTSVSVPWPDSPYEFDKRKVEEWNTLSGGDLKVGGEGMKGFYDEILPRFMNKYGKKWGAKVEDVELPNVEEAGRVMHSVDVTEEMRESVMEGQVMFSRKNVNDKFNTELQQQIDGTLPKGHVYQLGMPSEILRSAGIEDLPIELAASRLEDKSMQGNHPFDLSEVENLPEAIQNPLAVFVSATKIGSSVILTELKHGGKNFVAALRVKPNKKRTEVNQIRSLYPKNTMSIIDWINNDLATYVDKGRMNEWLEKQRNELLSKPQSNSVEVRKQLVSAANVVKDFENPSIDEGKVRAYGNNDTRFSRKMGEVKAQLADMKYGETVRMDALAQAKAMHMQGE